MKELNILKDLKVCTFLVYAFYNNLYFSHY